MLLFLIIITQCHVESKGPIYNLTNARKLFEDTLIKYGKFYDSEDEKEYHFEVFVENLKEINKLNRQGHPWPYEINQFTDVFPETMKHYNLLKP